jgi:hypothetical protein
MTTLTLVQNVTLGGSGTSYMQQVNGVIAIVVTGQPVGCGLLVTLFGAADFAAQNNSASCITITQPGTYTLTAVNAMGIRAALLAQPSSPVTVTAQF